MKQIQALKKQEILIKKLLMTAFGNTNNKWKDKAQIEIMIKMNLDLKRITLLKSYQKYKIEQKIFIS